ncbi:MAG: hypothetical protein KAT65_24885 [Methanophagales archaeon]|nr:hypothetical protein [Methanophagales archaeon]
MSLFRKAKEFVGYKETKGELVRGEGESKMEGKLTKDWRKELNEDKDDISDYEKRLDDKKGDKEIWEIGLKSDVTPSVVFDKYCEDIGVIPTTGGKKYFAQWIKDVPPKYTRQCFFSGIYWAVTHPEDIEIMKTTVFREMLNELVYGKFVEEK